MKSEHLLSLKMLDQKNYNKSYSYSFYYKSLVNQWF